MSLSRYWSINAGLPRQLDSARSRSPKAAPCNERRLSLGDRREDQDLDHRKNHHQRRNKHRHLRARADRAAGRDRCRNAADRDARGERRRRSLKLTSEGGFIVALRRMAQKRDPSRALTERSASRSRQGCCRREAVRSSLIPHAAADGRAFNAACQRLRLARLGGIARRAGRAKSSATRYGRRQGGPNNLRAKPARTLAHCLIAARRFLASCRKLMGGHFDPPGICRPVKWEARHLFREPKTIIV